MDSWESYGTATTNTDLLLGLKDRGNDQVWGTFCARYQPVLISFGKRLGLSESDAQDAAQEALLAFCDAYRQGKYEPAKGRLRTWLFGIAAHKIRDIQRQNNHRPAVVDPETGTAWMDRVPDDHSISDIWEAEWRRAILDACMDEVYRHIEVSTIRAFELFVLEEWPVEKVAAHLNMSRNAVFKAQRRVLTRLREKYRYLNANW